MVSDLLDSDMNELLSIDKIDEVMMKFTIAYRNLLKEKFLMTSMKMKIQMSTTIAGNLEEE